MLTDEEVDLMRVQVQNSSIELGQNYKWLRMPSKYGDWIVTSINGVYIEFKSSLTGANVECRYDLFIKHFKLIE